MRDGSFPNGREALIPPLMVPQWGIGGYCVFAEVADDDSFATVDKIADEVKKKGKVHAGFRS